MYFGVLDTYQQYSSEVYFTVPQSLPTGEYVVVVFADVFGTLFEFNMKENNKLMKNINIVQQLPDLALTSFNFSFSSDRRRGITTLNLKNVFIANLGKASVSKTFVDVVYLVNSYNQKEILAERTQNVVLKIGQSYEIEMNISIPRKIVPYIQLVYYTDYINNILEIEENNNYYVSDIYNLTIFYDNIMIDIVNFLTFRFNESGRYLGKDFFSGETLLVVLNYTNLNEYPTSKSFTDEVYIQKLEKEIFLTQFYNEIIEGNSSVTKVIEVLIPEWIYGEISIVVKHDTEKSLIGSNFYSIKKPCFISVSPFADLKPYLIYAELSDDSRLLNVSWFVKNIGNSMHKLISWKDLIVLSPNSSDPFASGSIRLYSFDITGKLQSDQEYSQSHKLPAAIKISGFYYVFVLVDIENQISEWGGETNNYIASQGIWFSLPVLAISDLILTIDSLTMLSVTPGLRSSITYSVQNTLEPTSVSSWTDVLSISPYASENFIPISSYNHIGVLGTNMSYTVVVPFTFPYTLKTGVYVIKITTDKNEKCNDKNRSNNFKILKNITVNEPDPADLTASSNSDNVTGYTGQPLFLSYNVTNFGPGSISFFNWYDCLYLSTDPWLDQFDRRLVTQLQTRDMPLNSSYSGLFQFSLPFSVALKKYYLILKVDNEDVVYDNNRINNLATISISIIETKYTLDLFVSNLECSLSVKYGEKLSANWLLNNNGTETAVGYKCDSLYLSEDSLLDFDDAEVSTTCSFMSIQSKGILQENMLDYVPLVKQSNFYSIVKTRSSVLDFNISNNQVGSLATSFLFHEVLNISTTKNISAYSGKEYVLIVPGVTSGQTILFIVKSYDLKSNVGLYLKFGTPATLSNFDEFQGEFKSFEQKLVLKNTKRGDYYLLITCQSERNFYSIPTLVSVEAKLAKLDIVRVFPNVVPPSVLPVTLKIQGSLFPPDFSLSFYSVSDEKKAVMPLNTYRFSSSLLYATVAFSNFTVGDEITICMLDLVSSTLLKTEKFIRVMNIPTGILKGNLRSSRVARVGEDVEVTIVIQNIGGTDISSPIFYLDVQGDVAVKVNRENTVFDNNQNLIFIPPSTGPAGILPPGSTNTISLSIIQSTLYSTTVPISMGLLVAGEDDHPYATKKNEFMPLNFDNRRWDPVWKVFMKRVGHTMTTFQNRMCETATHLSLLNQNVVLLDKLVQFELMMADGISIGNELYRVVDVKAIVSGYFPFLNIERFFSPRLSFRDVPGKYNGYGPFGKGWISPLWFVL